MAANRPGLPAVNYRIGTYSSFRRSMLSQIPRSALDDTATEETKSVATFSGLTSLTTRRSDDFSITLLDLWAAVADTLSFYQERLANESFLRTATQPDSVLSLATLTGSALPVPPAAPAPASPPSPSTGPAPAAGKAVPAPAPHATLGTAGETSLLLTVDTGARVAIDPGLRVQSVPGPNEKPVTFETIESAVADARFNRLRLYPPRRLTPGGPAALQQLKLGGLLGRSDGPALADALKPGDDAVLFGPTSTVEEKKIAKIDVAEDRVQLTWQAPVTEAGHTLSRKFKRRFSLFGSTAPATYMQPGTPGPAGRMTWTLVELGANGFAYPAVGYPEEQQKTPPGVGASLCDRICLDGRYLGLDPGKHVLVADTAPGGGVFLATIEHVDQAVATFGPFPGTVTRLWVAVDNTLGLSSGQIQFGDRRTVVVYELEDPALVFSPYDYDLDPATTLGTEAWLAGQVIDEPDGQHLLTGLTIAKGQFSGGVLVGPKDFDIGRPLVVDDGASGPVLVHVTSVPALVADSDGKFGHLVLTFDALAQAHAATAAAKGNLVLASHGETVAKEVLGSGDASVPYQEFKLKKSPLTLLPTGSPGGRATTLHVFVDGIEWREVGSLAGQDGSAQVYVTETDAEGVTTVRFGDGKHGRVLTTGRSNVTATYRYGSGTPGNVRAASLSTLLDRPTGLLAAINPFPAAGGTDPRSVPATKAAVGVAMRTIGRLVTLADLVDLALAAGNVAKARAALLRVGQGSVLQVTVAAQEGRPLRPDELARLAAAIGAAQDGTRRLLVQDSARIPIQVEASVQLDRSAPASDVLASARQGLLTGLGFDALGLGQTLLPSDVHAALEAVPGVTGVNLTRFAYKTLHDAQAHGAIALPNGLQDPLQPRLVMFPARMSPGTGSISPAELATIEVPGQDVAIVVKAPG